MESQSDEFSKMEEELLPSQEKMVEDLGGNKDILCLRAMKVFTPAFIKDRFQKMRIEGLQEWIPQMENKPQSYKEFLNSKPNKIFETKKTIYILPLDQDISLDLLEKCQNYLSAFYNGLPVKLLESKKVKGVRKKNRKRDSKIQLHAKTVISKAKKKLPKDAYAMIWVLNRDLYNRNKSDYCFGFASLKSKVGVISLARYDPSFYDEEDHKTPEEVQELIEYRAMKGISQAVGSMFGLKHCTYYKCLMNGSASNGEALKKPSTLCIICLKKLYFVLKCDLLCRYTDLHQIWSLNKNFKDTTKWLEDAIEYLSQIYELKKIKIPSKARYPNPKKKKASEGKTTGMIIR